MKKFKFSLEAYLRLKTIEERKCMIHLSKITSKLGEIKQAEKNYILENQAILLAEAQKLQNNILDTKYYIMANTYLDSLRIKKEALENKYQSLSHELSQRQANLLQATSEKKNILKYKEQEKRNYIEQRGKYEQEEMDAFNSRQKSIL